MTFSAVFLGLDTTDHILGREMLMVPILRKTNPEHKNTNIEKLIQKHAHFYAKLDYAQSADFVEIDRKATECKCSVRDMVMELTILDGHQTQLFWSIDTDKNNMVNFTFPAFIAEAARNIIAQLPSLLKHLYGLEVLPFLTDAAQRRAIDAPCDENLMCARSKDDMRLEAMVIATASMDDVTSDLDSEDDSIDTAAELDGDEEREANEYTFRRASTNASVTTIDTRVGKSHRKTKSSVHEIEASPTKRQKNTTRKFSPEAARQLNEEIERESTNDFEGAAMDSEPTQLKPQAPESLEDSGAAL